MVMVLHMPGYPGFWLVSDWNGEIFMIYPDYHKVPFSTLKMKR